MGKPDAATKPLFQLDSGAGGTGDGGGGRITTSTDDPKLKELLGGYVFRVDDYSSATTTLTSSSLPVSVTLSLKTRTSYLGVAVIADDSGQLTSLERLCHETYQVKCQNGCVNGSTYTEISPYADALFPTVAARSRRLTLSDDQLFGDAMIWYVGYDPSSNPALPTSSSDPRVWDPISGSPREGLYTHAVLEVQTSAPFPLTKTAECYLDIVQQYKTIWNTKLATVNGAYKLDRLTIPLSRKDAQNTVINGVDSKIIDAMGGGDTSKSDCMGDSAGNDTELPTTLNLRFAKVDLSMISNGCPDAQFYDSALPANPADAP